MTTQLSPTRLAAAALATSRLTRLVTEDTLTEPLRNAVYDRFGDPSTLHTARERLSPSYLVSCPYCASVHAGFATAVLDALAHSPTTPAPLRRIASVTLLALATSGVVSLIKTYVKEPPTSGSGGWGS